MRVVLLPGGDPDASSHSLAGMPLFAAALLALGFCVGLALAMVHVAVTYRWAIVEELVQTTRAQEQTLAQERTARALQRLASNLAELHVQVLQLQDQGERVALLSGTRSEWRDNPKPENKDLLAVTSPSFDSLQGEIDFITRQVELKTDEMTMVELFLLEQRIRSHAETSYVLPVPPQSRIVSGYGLRPDPFTGRRAMHSGIDFQVPEGTPVLAVSDGIVLRSVALPDYGNLVEIEHRDGQTTRYGHLQRSLVKVGQPVKRGEQIALSGNTGRSVGAHLHFEVREFGVARNPISFFLRRETIAKAATAVGR